MRIAFTLLFFLFALSARGTETLNAWLQRAEQSYQRSQFAAAEEQYRKALNDLAGHHGESFFFAQIRLANVLPLSGKEKEAVTILRDAGPASYCMVMPAACIFLKEPGWPPCLPLVLF
ncbi:MAG TPA: hypothetical protein VGE26_01180 [Sphingobacteriaceae bacterium]